MLSGKLPADHPDAVLKPGWRPPVNPRFSPPLQDLLDRLLAVKPQRRPQVRGLPGPLAGGVGRPRNGLKPERVRWVSLQGRSGLC